MTDGSYRPLPPPGWYPHPTMADTQCYWDGAQWTANVAPIGAAAVSPAAKSPVPTALIVVGVIVGLVMAAQSANLLTGTGTQWTGTAITIGAAVAAFVMRGAVANWVRVVAVIAALLALANVIYLEVQIDNQRDKLSHMFDG